jgi:hypothetical protein
MVINYNHWEKAAGWVKPKASLAALQSRQHRQAVTRNGNDSVSQVLCQHHTQSANTV